MNEQLPIDESQYSDEDQVIEILNEYWPNEADPKVLWSTLMDKETEFYEAAERRGLFWMCRAAYAAYFGIGGNGSGAGAWETQTLSFGGENGELIEFSVNEFRSFCDQVFNMTTKNRPSFQAQAINTDFKSLAQIESADAFVQSYYEQEYGERKEKETVKLEGLYSKAYTHIDWDQDGGREIEVDDEIPSNMGAMPGKKKVKSGEFVIDRCYWWDVVCEPYRSEMEGHLWRMVLKNKRSMWEMVARFPLFADAIKKSQYASSAWAFRFPGVDPMAKEPEGTCAVRIFYHTVSGACPKGWKITYVNDVQVERKELPVDEIPLKPLMANELHGTCFGVSDLWNLIPLDQMQNQVLSDMATNIESFGRPPLVLTEGTDIDLDSLANGQKVIFKPAGSDDPAPIKFPQIPDVSWKMLELMRSYKQSLSGLNAIARGDTSSNITSGAHAALYSQIAVEAQSPRQLDLDLHREAIGNLLIKFLKKFAKFPQLVAVAGIDERAYLTQFKQEDWDGIERVVIKTANPAMRTQAGRLQIAELLKSWPGMPLRDPAQIVELITSGQFKPMINGTRTAELRARYENEQLLQGPPVQTTQEQDPTTGMMLTKSTVPTVKPLATDNAQTHINMHLEVINSPASQQNPAVLQAVLTHILEHIEIARSGDGYLAALLGNPLPEALMMGAQDPTGNGQAQPPGGKPSDKTQGDAQKVMQDPEDQDDSLGAKLPSPANSPVQAQN